MRKAERWFPLLAIKTIIWRSLAALMMLLSLWTPVHAGNWGVVKGWSIHWLGVDSEASCFARNDSDTGLTTTILVSPSLHSFLLSLRHRTWQSIKADEKYPVQVAFDDQVTRGTMTGLEPGQVGSVLHEEAFKYMLLAQVMTITYKGELLGKIDISNVVDVLKALESCQKAKNPAAWPWTKPAPDPFRR